MIKLTRLGHVLLSVRNLEVSKDFYIRVLGFKLLEQDPAHGGVFLALGSHGNTLDLFESTHPGESPPPPAELGPLAGLGVKHVAFAVDMEEDLKNAYLGLQEHGVPIKRALDHESQKSVYFHDPDGNLLEIVWERPDALAIFAKGRGDDDTEITFAR